MVANKFNKKINYFVKVGVTTDAVSTNVESDTIVDVAADVVLISVVSSTGALVTQEANNKIQNTIN